MSDALLTRIAVALEAIANQATGGSANAGGTGGAPIGGDITGVAGNAAVTGTVTHDMLMALVQPLVGNEATKAQVKSVLNTNGLNRLGEATEAQYPVLYAAFKAIADGGAPAAAEQSLI